MSLQPVHMDVYMYIAKSSEELREYAQAVEYFEKYLEVFSTLKGKEDPNYHGVSQHKDRLKACLEAKSSSYPNPFIHIKYENGGAAMIDVQYAQYHICEHPDPSQASLDQLITGVNKIDLLIAKANENILEWETITEVDEADAIEDFLKNIQITEDEPFGHMMGIGEHKMILHKPDGSHFEMEILSENLIRLPNHWKHDAKLKEASFLREWLSQYGIDLTES